MYTNLKQRRRCARVALHTIVMQMRKAQQMLEADDWEALPDKFGMIGGLSMEASYKITTMLEEERTHQ